VVTSEDDRISQALLAELIGFLVQVTGEDEQWAAKVTRGSRLEGDLELDSIEIAALRELLDGAHGDRLRLSEFAASLDIDQIIELTVGDLVNYLRERR
jgi:acyl carrier protein